eukprot:CAMPEP_0168761146 /NCGR_PEP_ID=MMETSP0724-20121128/23149_1 /TAXON_ID=265536 /ORGANISM="Amphiprora sp., Strain CCMP467" /LENGTH=106 /DNA_ID=CAMNT_0008810213 /DNA_START=17 /DNA_END=333 /DNA_ORIENTATION=-
MTQPDDELTDALRLQWYFRLCPGIFLIAVILFVGFPEEFDFAASPYSFDNIRVNIPGKETTPEFHDEASSDLALEDLSLDEPALGSPEYVLRHVKPRAFDSYPASA